MQGEKSKSCNLKEILKEEKMKCENFRWKENHNFTVIFEVIQKNIAKKKKKRFKESSGLLALSLTIIILVIIIICYLIVPRGSINNLHTESDSHLLGLLKGEAVAPSAWTGA